MPAKKKGRSSVQRKRKGATHRRSSVPRKRKPATHRARNRVPLRQRLTKWFQPKKWQPWACSRELAYATESIRMMYAKGRNKRLGALGTMPVRASVSHGCP
jgi:hypothetical protein